MAAPIWKDYNVTLGLASGGPYQFRILADGTPIYTGKAYGKPGTTYIKCRINDICADYLTRNLPYEADDYYTADFIVQVYTSGSWVTAASVSFARDWSYDTSFIHGTDIPVAPIAPVLHPMQYLPLWGPGGEYDFDLILRPASPGDFNVDFNDDFLYFGASTIHESDAGLDGDFFFYDLTNYNNVAAVEANGLTYKVLDLCGGYVLYYINAYGGWDSIPVTGRAKRTDKVTHYNTEKVYDNANYFTRGRDNYVNEIEPSLHLTLGPLTTEQSSRAFHLLESTYVYIHDIEKGRIHPVVISATSVEHKVRPGALHFYEFDVALAQNRIRR